MRSDDAINVPETSKRRTLLPTGQRRVLIVTATVAAVAYAVVRRRSHRAVGVVADPCGPEGLLMPEGDHRTLITDDGARLATLVVGPSGGPTVVLAHCWMGG